MNWPISWQNVKDHIDDVEDGINPELLPKGVPYIEEGVMVEVLPECQPIGGGEPLSFVVSENVPTLIVGETYIVNWNGVDYNCIIQDLSATMPGAVGFGDLTQMGANGNGEPFGAMVAENPSGVILVFQPLDGTTELTVSIKQGSATIHKLDPRCLPSGVPYIEEGAMVELLPETTMEISAEPPMGMQIPNLGLVVGESYTVTFNGVDYECVAVDGLGVPPSVMLGNIYAGVPDMETLSDEPFVVAEVHPDDMDIMTFAMPVDLTMSSPFTISIKQGSETIHKLDSRCLPSDATEMYLTSPNGTIFKITVSDDGTLTTAVV